MSKPWPEGPTHLEGFDTWVQTLILMRFMRRGGGRWRKIRFLTILRQKFSDLVEDTQVLQGEGGDIADKENQSENSHHCQTKTL